MKFDDDMMISTMKKRRSKRPRMGTSCTSSSSSSSSREWDSTIQYFSSSSPSSSDLEEDMAANCLILLAQGRRHVHDDQEQQQLPPFMAAKELYACKTCNRIFPSFQALGGHRASHKKLIKTSSPPAIIPSSSSSENQEQRYEEDLTTLSLQIHPMVSSNKNKMHDCSICGAEFTSGQALGGHMRRHRPLPPPTASSREQSKKARNLMSFDLNLPAAPAEEERRESSFPAALWIANY